MRARGGGLDELHQYAAGITRVHEVDPRVRGPAARLGVEQPHALLPQRGARGVDVGDPVGQLLKPGPLRSMNFPIGESGRSGARSWIAAPASPGADSMASRTPCSSFVSVWVATRPSVSAYQVIASSRSATAIPT